MPGFSAHVLLENKSLSVIPNRWLRRRLLHSETQASAMLQPKAVLATEISGCGIYLFDVSVPLLQSALRYTYIQIQRLERGRPGPEYMHPGLLR